MRERHSLPPRSPEAPTAHTEAAAAEAAEAAAAEVARWRQRHDDAQLAAAEASGRAAELNNALTAELEGARSDLEGANRNLNALAAELDGANRRAEAMEEEVERLRGEIEAARVAAAADAGRELRRYRRLTHIHHTAPRSCILTLSWRLMPWHVLTLTPNVKNTRAQAAWPGARVRKGERECGAPLPPERQGARRAPPISRGGGRRVRGGGES